MMLTAVNAHDGQLLDVTTLAPPTIDILNGKTIARRHGYDIVCRGCLGPAHLVRNHHHTVFFRHNPGVGRACIIREAALRGGGESPAHIEAKVAIATAVRSLKHWTAEFEQPYGNRTTVVDVTATYTGKPSHDGQGMFAWEVQLSPQTAGEFVERTQTIERTSGARPSWLTPHVNAVGECQAMICDPDAKAIVDRLLISYSPELAAPPTAVDEIVKSVHRHHPGHRWTGYQQEDGTHPFYVIDVNAFNSGPPQLKTASRRRVTSVDATDDGCTRTATLESWTPPTDIDYPHADLGPYHCALCGSPEPDPWGFTFDPPLCRGCFLNRQANPSRTS